MILKPESRNRLKVKLEIGTKKHIEIILTDEVGPRAIIYLPDGVKVKHEDGAIYLEEEI